MGYYGYNDGFPAPESIPGVFQNHGVGHSRATALFAQGAAVL